MNANKKRKANLNDGCNPELGSGAKFDGFLEIPIIEAPNKIIIPSGFTPFSKRELAVGKDEAIVVDYKTNRSSSKEYYANLYKTQLNLYKLACS